MPEPRNEKFRVAEYSETLAAILRRADELGVYAIARVQDSQSRSLSLSNGRLETISQAMLAGVGLQVFTQEGFTSFICSDEINPAIGRELVETAASMAHSGSGFATRPSRAVFDLTPDGVATYWSGYKSLDETDYPELVKQMTEANEAARRYGSHLVVRTQLSLTDTHWRIVRSDGTDLSFDQPTSLASHTITAIGSASRLPVNLGATISGADDSILLQPASRNLWELRTRNAAHLATALTDAPLLPASHSNRGYKLILDYALAKGLAHEAFGHASESDVMATSVLGDHGKMRLGEQLGPDTVTITDGSILGDYAYQPISACGKPRQTVNIMEEGRLVAGLADLFSAEKAGLVASGAERVESYRHLPLPRMSNIRITLKDPAPFDRPFEEITPLELQARLIEIGYIKEGEPCLYLAGYNGGQVMPKEGDFVFNCAAIYDLSLAQPKLYQPAIFSGKILSVLQSIQGGLGPLHLDAQGHCGKGGQNVPSSGGSHSFIVIAPNEQIFVGGR
ncbi:MAG: TldD/PmbA family protein [Chloroflexota bacterium]|nr:TldD/PmbA family protein [Chloroflexota bacterium]